MINRVFSVATPAYVDLWRQEPERCAASFAKLSSVSPLVSVTNPPLVFPLLPVIRGKHKWRHEQHGVDYK